MKRYNLLVLSLVAVALSGQHSRANSCAPDIDRAWSQVNAKIQARIGAGRSTRQDTTALLHRQPTQNSIAAATEALADVWLPMEAAVAALTRASAADRVNDRLGCQNALADVQLVIGR